MIQTNADIVPGDSGGPLASPAGVIGMDTAGNNVSYDQQASATGFAIPINTALSVARQIAAGHASSTIAIGYPPFMGIFVAAGSSSSPRQAGSRRRNSSRDTGWGLPPVAPGAPRGATGAMQTSPCRRKSRRSAPAP